MGWDPGDVSGACAVLTSHNVVAYWATYKRLDRKGKPPVWRMTDSHGAGDEFATVGQVAGEALKSVPVALRHLVVEGLYVETVRSKRRHESMQQYMRYVSAAIARQKSTLKLSESAGQIIGAIGQPAALRPKATEWRWDQLSLPARTKADYAEAAAVKLAPDCFTWPEAEWPKTKAERGALAEAAFISRFGWVRTNTLGAGAGARFPSPGR